MNDDPVVTEEGPTPSLQAKLDAVATRQIPIKTDEDFKTPDEAAVQDAVAEPASVEKIGKWAAFKTKMSMKWPFGKREWVVSTAVVLLCSGIVTLVLMHINASKPAVVAAAPIVKTKKVALKPTTAASTLSGLQVDPSVNQKPVTAAMIENSVDARPQSGLGQAGVVFEAIAEGGVTRFMALFQDTSPDNIGPIRSARPYYEQWALGFDAGYAHVGGSPDGLADIKAWNVRDLDQFSNSGSYHRTADRQAPHNVYTAVSTLNQLEAAKGYTTSTYTGFVRAAKEAPTPTPAAKTIDMAISGPVYNPHYEYVAATNSYNRSEGGTPHTDANTNTQISPKVVIAMIVPKSQGALDSSNAYYSEYATIGSGGAYIFQNGSVTIGTWKKTANNAQITFTDSTGKAIGLNPGQTWITALGSTSEVTYTP